MLLTPFNSSCSVALTYGNFHLDGSNYTLRYDSFTGSSGWTLSHFVPSASHIGRVTRNFAKLGLLMFRASLRLCRWLLW